MAKNERIGKALKMSKLSFPKRKHKKRRYAFEDRDFAKKASAIARANRGVRIATTTMRIQKDAVALAQSAWKNRDERVSATSELIREGAKKRLSGLK